MKQTTLPIAAMLFAAVASPLAAQQPNLRAPLAAPRTPPVAAPLAPPAGEPATVVTGPRVRLDLPAVAPASSESPALPNRRAVHTITITTLALVLAVIILVLLIA